MSFFTIFLIVSLAWLLAIAWILRKGSAVIEELTGELNTALTRAETARGQLSNLAEFCEDVSPEAVILLTPIELHLRAETPINAAKIREQLEALHRQRLAALAKEFKANAEQFVRPASPS